MGNWGRGAALLGLAWAGEGPGARLDSDPAGRVPTGARIAAEWAARGWGGCGVAAPELRSDLVVEGPGSNPGPRGGERGRRGRWGFGSVAAPGGGIPGGVGGGRAQPGPEEGVGERRGGGARPEGPRVRPLQGGCGEEGRRGRAGARGRGGAAGLPRGWSARL